MSPALPTLNSHDGQQAAAEFIRNSPTFFCGYGRVAFLEGRLPIVSLPHFRLEGSGKRAPRFEGNLASVFDMAGLQECLQRALSDYKRANADGIVFVDPMPLRERDHETAYNRTWSIYAQLGVACLRLFAAPEESALVASLSNEQILNHTVLPIADDFASPEHFDHFSRDGQLYDGDSHLHFFSMNPLFPQSFPRWAPLNLMLITNLTKVQEALQRSPGPGLKMTRSYPERTSRPYNGDLPYVIDANPLFDPPLLKALQRLVIERRSLFPSIPIGGEDRACIQCYHQLQIGNKARESEIPEDQIVRMLQASTQS